MTRRDLLRAGGLLLAGFGVDACNGPAAQRRRARLGQPPPPQETVQVQAQPPAISRGGPVNLAQVNASWDRVIRTTVGLRPHRDSGFVLRADKLDDKTLIHNYGHGGAGMSLAWGTGALAADLALQHPERRAAVLGCGSPGLTAARQLQRRGFQVTIYAMSIPPDTTSNMSLAGYTPVSGLISRDKRTPAWDAQFRQAAEISYRQLQLMVGGGYGVYWQDSYSATDDPNRGGGGGGGNEGTGDLLPDALRTGDDREVLGPGDHPFPSKYAVRRSNLRIEPNVYLEALVREFLRYGGKIVIRKFVTPRDLMELSESVIVNCTGLGSKALFNDDELVPVKGQLTVMVPQREVTFSASGRPPGMPAPPPRPADAEGGNNQQFRFNASMNARSDGLVIGNMMERGNWTLDVNEEVRQRVVDLAVQFFRAMRAPNPRVPLTDSRAPQSAPSLDSFFDLDS